MVLLAFFIILLIVAFVWAFALIYDKLTIIISEKLTAILCHDSIIVKEPTLGDENLAEIKGSSSNELEDTVAPNKAKSPEEELRYAANLVVKYNNVSKSSSRWELGVDDQRAEAILSDLERLGIVGPKNPLNSFADRPVLVKDLNRLEDILTRHELLVRAIKSHQ